MKQRRWFNKLCEATIYWAVEGLKNNKVPDKDGIVTV